MSKLVQDFFDAVNTIAKDEVSAAKNDATVDAEIKSVVNIDIGQYKVAYQGNVFDAYSSDPLSTYDVGEQVYVLVPQGDFSKRKVILGRSAYKNNTTFQDQQDMTNFYIEKGPNWITDWYQLGHDSPLQICAVPYSGRNQLKHTTSYESATEQVAILQPAYEEALANYEANPDNLQAEMRYLSLKQQLEDALKLQEEALNSTSTVGANYFDYGFMRTPDQGEDYDSVNRYPQNYPDEETLKIADEQIQRYSSAYGAISISATFRTAFQNTHTTGQYALVVECIKSNPKYITDVRDPNAQGYMGTAWYEAALEYYNFVENIDAAKMAEDEEYKAQVDAQSQLLLEALNKVIPDQKQYQTVKFKLGFNVFTGAPYSYVTDTPQKGYYSVEKGTLQGLSRVYLEQDGNFVADISPTYNPDGTISWDAQHAILDRNNIFCDAIDIRFCEKINLTDTLYYPWIETPYGDAVYGPNTVSSDIKGRGFVTLVAHLQYGYKDILSADTCQVYWFKQDPEVTQEYAERLGWTKDAHGNTYYDYGGDGWYPIELMINNSEEGSGNYDIDFNTLVVRRDAVLFKNVYKAVIVYRDMDSKEQSEITRCSVEQEIVRADSEYDLVIVQETSANGKDVTLRVVNNYKPDTEINSATGERWPQWFGTWWLKSQAGAYYQISEGIQEGPIIINDFLFDDVATFYVQAYDPEIIDPKHEHIPSQQCEVVAVLSKTIITATEGDLLLDWVGEDTFNYDALGTIRGEADMRDNTLTPVIRWADGQVSSYHFTVIAPDGKTPLSNKEFYSKTSDTQAGNGFNWKDSAGNPMCMLKNMWCDQITGVIHFQLQSQYVKERATADRNTFKIRVTLVDGQSFDLTKTIRILKDGDMGTIGNEWSAPIRPCNWKYSKDKQEGPYIEELDYPALLIVNQTKDGEWVQDKNYRVFMRPFVTKGGISLETLDPFEGYFAKVYWDVRMPGSAAGADVKYASWLRLYHTDGTPSDPDNPGNIYGRQKSWYDTGNIELNGGTTDLGRQAWNSKVNEREQTPDGLVAFTMYPRRQYESEAAQFATENYGAVEVRFFDNAKNGTKADMERCMYRFIVKAQVDIMKGQYDQQTKMIETDGNVERIASITSFFPIDILLNYSNCNWEDPDSEQFDPIPRIATNWPRFISYNAQGYDPSNLADPLYFKFGPELTEEETNYKAFNLTPLTQTLEDVWNESTQQYDQMYRAKQHLNLSEGFHGAIMLDLTEIDGPFIKGQYIRNQVMYLNAYGNVDINGWDGQGIDMNEEDGTIFANTIGAGYKTPQTNLFTGVLMGVDRSQKKEDVEGLDLDEDSLKYRQYMTGIFGYQDGVSSFGIMENGTAFFGRADRGGRIIIDGANATIYGGGNGIMDSPSIGDPMWNTMRLTLADLNHATSPYGKNIDGYYLYNLNGEYFKYNAETDRYEKYEIPEGEGPIYMSIKNKVPSIKYIREMIEMPQYKDRIEAISTWWKIDETLITEEQYQDILEMGKEQDIDGSTTIQDTLASYFTKQENGSYLLTGDPEKTDIGYMTQGFDGKYFELDYGNAEIDKNKLPRWYGHLWQRAYVKPDGSVPYWLDALAQGNGSDTWRDLPKYLDEKTDNDPEHGLGWEKDNGQNYRINYFGPITKPTEGNDGKGEIIYLNEDGREFDSIEEYVNANKVFGPLYRVKADSSTMKGQDTSVLKAQQLSGFGPSRASTTPAIEIGQHLHGLMPGLIDWDMYEEVFKTLAIPGDRNFLVTYDGTLWAMNGVFMGAVIGSNIIGGRIQGAEIGIGGSIDANRMIWTMDPIANDPDLKRECDFELLYPPRDVKVPLKDLMPYTGDQPRAFYVSYDGSVYAQRLYIYGGSIDIGRFHILGEELDENGNPSDIDDEEYGHLVQAAESDFIGPTHFYGNVGIGPSLTTNKYSPTFGSSKGNLFQSRGYVALGIPVREGKDTEIHEKFILQMRQSSGSEGAGSMFYRATDYNRDGGDPKIGQAATVEQSAMFGLDSATNDIPDGPDDKENFFQGHFWPMHFHYGGALNFNSASNTADQSALTNAYITTMDIFQSKGGWVTTGTGGNDVRGANYFRVGPYGTEAMQIFIRKNFQSQDSSELPAPYNGLCDTIPEGSQYPADSYLGWIGLTNRAGYGEGSSLYTQFTVGITTWYTAPIIFDSDGESAWLTRGHIHFLTQAYGLSADQAATWGYDGKGTGTLGGKQWGVYLNMGRDYAYGVDTREQRNDSAANDFMVKTSHGIIRLSIDSHEWYSGGFDDPFHVANAVNGRESAGGIEINPYDAYHTGKAGLWLWCGYPGIAATRRGWIDDENKEEIHIVHKGSKITEDCAVATGMPEILIDNKNIYMYAPERIVMKFGDPNFSAHMLKKQAGEEDTSTEYPAIIEGDKEQVQLTHEKQLHIFIKQDNLTGSSEIAMYESKMDITASKLTLSGNGDSPHGIGNAMVLSPSRVDMIGSYAVPDNQYHIYARFG